MSKRQIKWVLGGMPVEDFKSQECTRHRKPWSRRAVESWAGTAGAPGANWGRRQGSSEGRWTQPDILDTTWPVLLLLLLTYHENQWQIALTWLETRIRWLINFLGNRNQFDLMLVALFSPKYFTFYLSTYWMNFPKTQVLFKKFG